jgi:epoxide hydrolase-like predicted phosphatase
MTFRAVTFDMGGVLTPPPAGVLYRRWEAHLGLPKGTAFNILIANNSVFQQAVIGQAAKEEVWPETSRQLLLTTGISLSPAELETSMVEIWKSRAWDEELLAFIRALRSEYQTGVISNAFPGTRERVEEYVNGDTFDVILFSDEEGVAKPDPEIYRRALSRLGVLAEETIFVDDLLPNVEAARTLGMQAVHYTGPVRVQELVNPLLRSHRSGDGGRQQKVIENVHAKIG